MTESEGDLLEAMTHRIVEAVHPKKVILFGSRARGEARPCSDYDFLVIEESGEPADVRARPLYSALAEFSAEVEIAVYTPEEVHEWCEVPQAFVTTAIREGKVLYEDQG